MAVPKATALGLSVVDVADPLHPIETCRIENANSGRFISATKIAFWHTQFVGIADLKTGSLNWSRAFVDSPSNLAFSPDGSNWAYQTGTDTDGITTHLVVAGKDRTILTRAPIGGHGGPSWGPVNQLEFSASGQFLLTYTLFGDIGVAPGAAPNFMVFAMDGSVAFRSSTAKFGTWDRAGSRLYFLDSAAAGGIGGQVRSWDPGGQPVTRGRALTSYFWPTTSRDGRLLLFNSYDAKGMPHLWRLEIASGGLVQLSTSGSTRPVLVGLGWVWSTEEQPCDCGPGGLSAPDGKMLAHDLQVGPDTPIGVFTRFAPSQAPTRDILDVWLG